MQYEFGFHSDPDCNIVVTQHGGRTYLVCLHCGVAGELEAISKKVSVADVLKVGKAIGRVSLGKLSAGVSVK